jgi:voltage-gated potassium channel
MNGNVRRTESTGVNGVADPVSQKTPATPGMSQLRARLRELYFGATPGAIRFRYWVIAVDLLLIGFFIASPFLKEYPGYLVVDYAIALVMAVEVSARGLAHDRLKDWIRKPATWIDLFVLATLLFPFWLFNLAFLRVLRIWSLFHSELFWTTIGRRYDGTRWEEVSKALSTMVTFVFVATGFVYTSFARTHPGIEGYVDALYFTVTALTTTGFGDITLPGVWGKLLSIMIMISGITLFVRLAQTLIRPTRSTTPVPVAVFRGMTPTRFTARPAAWC